MKHEYAFDVVLNTAIVIRADSPEEAVRILEGIESDTLGKVRLDGGLEVEIAEATAEKVAPKPYRVDGVDVESGQTLQQARDNEAESAFNMHRFPHPVKDTGGWEYTDPGREWRRAAFLEVPHANDSVKVTLLVRFEHDESAVIETIVEEWPS